MLTTIALAFVSVGLVVFVYIPFIKKIFTAQKQIKELKEEEKQLSDKVNLLTSTDTTYLNRIYQDSTEQIPVEINLGRLGNYITDLVNQSDLEIMQLSLTEEVSIQELTTETKQIRHTVRKVHIPIQVEGAKDDLLNFINLLLSGRYILDFDQIQLTQKGDENSENAEFIEERWILRMEIVQHTIPFIKDVDVNTPLFPLPSVTSPQ